MTDHRGGAARPPHPSAPQAGAYFEVMISEAEAKRRGEGPRVQVRCLACHRRAFDVSEVVFFTPDYGMIPDGSLMIERKCPSCKRNNRGVVTASPGDPLVAGPGLNGPWLCECGKSLGYVDPVRGRVKTTCCRCRAEIRTVAAVAISVASVPTRPVPDLPDTECPEDDPFADRPWRSAS